MKKKMKTTGLEFSKMILLAISKHMPSAKHDLCVIVYYLIERCKAVSPALSPVSQLLVQTEVTQNIFQGK